MDIRIICEIGINHNGDLSIAKRLIDAAKETGADIVKFQKRSIDKVYTKDFLNEPRKSIWGNTQRAQKEGLEFSLKDYQVIDQHCKDIGIEWFASAWDIDSLEFLDKFNLDYHKIASAMIIDKNFLKEVANRKKHTFISTGMSTEEDITTAVNIFNDKNTSFELMHCVSTYPMQPSDANLNTITALKKKYNCNVGYSGHESGIAVSIAASTLGISSLERHITLDRSMVGSDQAASLEIRGLRELVGSVRTVEQCMGQEKIGHILEEEIPISKKLRAHIKV